MAWKVAPALAAGNACVVKPSEIASLTTLELGQIAQEVGRVGGAGGWPGGRCMQWCFRPPRGPWLGCGLCLFQLCALAEARTAGLPIGCVLAQVGLPAGTLNIITGTGPDAGAPLRCGGCSALPAGGPGVQFLGTLGALPCAVRVSPAWQGPFARPHSPAHQLPLSLLAP